MMLYATLLVLITIISIYNDIALGMKSVKIPFYVRRISPLTMKQKSLFCRVQSIFSIGKPNRCNSLTSCRIYSRIRLFSDIKSSLGVSQEIKDDVSLPGVEQEKNDDVNLNEWNLKSLREEVSRQILRSIKKAGKLNEKKAKSSASLEQIDEEDTSHDIEIDLKEIQLKLEKLRNLDDSLRTVKAIESDKFRALLPLIKELQITPNPPVQIRGPKKIKQKPPPPRQPYFTYKSEAGIEIRVGRGASDNDELSCNPQYRDSDNWWLHVAGFAGSHVVIRSVDDDLVEKYRETVIDAAVLAAVNSKANQGGRVPVSLTRCRNVSKPSGAKPGLVQLRGDVRTINIDLRVEAKRLERLKKLE